jgi:glycosyltransferase EpsD
VTEDEKQQLLSISDVYVSASQHEGFCLANLEAMAASLPIVCYDEGGHTDYLVDGETGFLVGLNDVSQLTERCKRLIDSVQLRRQMGGHNARLVQQYFADRCASQYEALFGRLVQDGSRNAHVKPLERPAAP